MNVPKLHFFSYLIKSLQLIHKLGKGGIQAWTILLWQWNENREETAQTQVCQKICKQNN